MPLILTTGEPGVGKSTQHTAICKYAKDSVYLCMEVKDKKLLQVNGVNTIQIIQYTDTFEEDPIATLQTLESTLRAITRENKYTNVVLDGISDIRRFAMKEWIFKDNIERMKVGKPPRTSIHGDNKSAWAAINNRVMGILEPLVNWSNIKGTNVFFTAQMKDSYLDDKKVGRQTNAGDWVEYDVDVKCHLYRNLDGGHFMAKFTKMPGWAIKMEEDVPIAPEGYIGLLAERGLL